MMKIQTHIDNLFSFIEKHSPVKESSIPNTLKKIKMFEDHLRVLEDSGMIEIIVPMFNGERTFVFRSREIQREPFWGFGS